jgi:hypothetical protein
MNYAELNTASDILEAFDNCNNAGEEIELFEYLATRPNPPVGAFVSILNEVQLEPVLVLTIKAFGMITDRDLKELWQQNDVVLKLLSEKAKSGASDLIRWTAAVAIDAIGFGIVKISQHLPEKPVKIAERIVESKRKILIDSDDKSKGEQKIADRNDYRSFIDFWVYGATYDLRAITAKYRGKNSSIVVAEVVKAQGIHGIKETNKLLQKAEDRDYPDELTKQIYENDLFERFTQHLSAELLKDKNSPNFNHFVINQGHYLQSNDTQARLKAASLLLGIDENILNTFDSSGSVLLMTAKAISSCDFDLNVEFAYKELIREDLEIIINNLRSVSELVSRNLVREYCVKYLGKLSKDISLLSPGLSRKEMLAIAEKQRQEEETEKQRLVMLRRQRREEEAQRQSEILAKEKAEQQRLAIAEKKWRDEEESLRQAEIREKERAEQKKRDEIAQREAARMELWAIGEKKRQEEQEREKSKQSQIESILILLFCMIFLLGIFLLLIGQFSFGLIAIGIGSIILTILKQEKN